MTEKDIQVGVKSSETIYKDSKAGDTIIEDERLPATVDKDYDEIKIMKKKYHNPVHCDDCHKEVGKVYAIHKTTFIVQKCSECMMDWLELKNPEFKSELTKELL